MSDLGEQLENTWEVQCQTNTGEGGYLAMKDLWESGARPDGLVTAHEAIALGAMRYLHELGIRVPEDVSVTSYETSVLGGYSIPPLTSVNIKKEEMGCWKHHYFNIFYSFCLCNYRTSYYLFY